MIPCERYKADLLKMVDDELEADARKAVKQHLNECRNCSEFIRELLQLRSYLKSLPSIKTSEGFQYLLRERIRREMKGKRIQRRQWATSWAPAFAVAVLAFISGYVFLNHHLEQSSTPQNTLGQQPVSQSPAYNEVDYVLNTHPQVAQQQVEKHDHENTDHQTTIDSLTQKRNLENIQARITPVSF